MAKKSRKVFATTATAALVASAVAPIASSAAGFSDVTKPEYKEAINALADAGILNGYENGTFKPENKVTRGEVAKVITLIRHLEDGTKTPFKDVKDGYWSTKFINSLYAAKLVNGYEDGTFKPEGNVTRAEFAKLVVDAYGLTLTNSATPFTDVKAGNWATPYIQTAYANGLIKGVTASKFDPSAPIKRGDLAILLHRADSKFGDVIGNNFPGVELVKATNATTVEVTFKEEVKDVKASNFSIDGLTISNAAVKQSDSKTVVLTTSAQEGGKLYTVKSGAATLGKFTGISAVIPTSIKTVSTSVQGVVGKEVTLKADVGVKQAGVAVTFNVDAPAGSLNKDQVEEVYTDENGVATYSYTQYAAGTDTVAVYPTGAPAVRDFATVYWGVKDILTISDSDDKKGTELVNGEKKTYKVTYLDPATGKGVPNQKLNVTFDENINVTADKLSKATVKDPLRGDEVTPYQLSNGTVKSLTVTTDKDGVATFTITGTNTTATPVVFLDQEVNKVSNGKLDSTELVAKAAKVTFAGAQVANKFTLTAEGPASVATGADNGRLYKLVVTDKDGKPYAGGVVNLGLNEEIDKDMSTKTSASFVKGSEGTLLPGKGKDAKNQLKLNAKGEAEFYLVSEVIDDYATPVVWIDQNTSLNTQEGTLENGEPSIVGEKTFFEKASVKGSSLKTYKDGEAFDKTFVGAEVAEFRYDAVNQSGNAMSNIYKKVTFDVKNNGSEPVVVTTSDGGRETIQGYGSTTIKVDGYTTAIFVTSNGENGNVSVSASGYQISSKNESKYLGNQTATAAFSKYATGNLVTGTVSQPNTDKDTLYVIDADGKSHYFSYADSIYKQSGDVIQKSSFEKLLNESDSIEISVTKDADGKLTFNILKTSSKAKTSVTGSEAFNDSYLNATENAVEQTITINLDSTIVAGDYVALKLDNVDKIASRAITIDEAMAHKVVHTLTAGTSDGEHNLVATVVDVSKNETSTGSLGFTVDTASPTAEVVPFSSTAKSFELRLNENAKTVTSSDANADVKFDAKSVTVTLAADATSGKEVVVEVTDLAGNKSTIKLTYNGSAWSVTPAGTDDDPADAGTDNDPADGGN